MTTGWTIEYLNEKIFPKITIEQNRQLKYCVNETKI